MNRWARLMLFFVVCVIFPLKAKAVGTEGIITMAVFDFKANGVSESLARSVTELFLVNLVESNEIKIVERTDIEKIMHEHELMLMGFTEESDAIEAGKLLSAHKVLIGTVNKFGSRLLLTARVVDVEQGYTEHAEKAELDSEEDLIYEINRISKRIVTKVTNIPEEEEIKYEEEYPVPLDNISSLPEAIMTMVNNALRKINDEMKWEEKDENERHKGKSSEETLFEPAGSVKKATDQELFFLNAAYAGFDFNYYFTPLHFGSYSFSVRPAFLVGAHGSAVFRGGFKFGAGIYGMIPFTEFGSDLLLFGFGGPILGWEFGSDKFQISIDSLIGAGRYSILSGDYIERMNEWYFVAFPKLRLSFELIDWVHMNIDVGYLFTNSTTHDMNSIVVGIGFQTGWWRENR
jgi:TolB-like protein